MLPLSSLEQPVTPTPIESIPQIVTTCRWMLVRACCELFGLDTITPSIELHHDGTRARANLLPERHVLLVDDFLIEGLDLCSLARGR
jgi:hypothetical protein